MLGFSYSECPLPVMSYREFVGNQFGVTPMDDDFELTVAEWGDDLRSDYEQYVTSSDSKAAVTPIRYDYLASDYKAGSHPASHVHFGFRNEVRVGTRRIMNPVSFTLFIIRQRYPQSWRRFLEMGQCEVLCRNVREDIDSVNAAYWQQRDDLEVALH